MLQSIDNLNKHKDASVKKAIATIALSIPLSFLSLEASAWEQVPPTVTNNQSSTNSWGGVSDNNSRENKTGYESSSGNSYQYNLNNPSDRVRYKNDPKAKIRDKHDPRVNIDRNNLNQHGGGIYD